MSISITKRCLQVLEKCKNLNQLKQAHAQILTSGLGYNTFALSRLLDLCSNPVHGSLTHSWKFFNRIENPTICICNTMIKALLLKGELHQTVLVYSFVLRNGLRPSNYTLPYLLKACARLKSAILGGSVHVHCLKLGFVSDLFVGNALIAVYCGLGDMQSASHVFNEMPELSFVSWTVMISGYAKVGDVDNARLLFDEVDLKDRGIWGAMISAYVQNNCFKEGLYMFQLMQMSDIEPDEAIFVSILCACANLGTLDTGIWIHWFLDRLRLPVSVRLGTGLIDMYAKCGNLDLAKKLFYEMPQRDTICWNAMISGMAINGDGESALKFFSKMEEAKILPDDITFIAVFTACSYSGMAYEALRVLNKMCQIYNIVPKSEHYGCLVDLLSRAGLFEEAKEIIQRLVEISSTPYEEAVAWRAFLSACYNRGEGQLAEVAAKRLFGLEHHGGVHVLLSNLYAKEGKQSEVKRVRSLMKSKGVEKGAPGCSSIEIKGVVNEFVAGEKMHPKIEEIQSVLENMKKQLDYLVYHN